MIERHWSAMARKGMADDYILHLTNDTFPQLKTLQGFINAKILTRDTAEGTEFLIITAWENIKAVENFAGKDISVAVVPDHVQKLMIRFDREAKHFEVTLSGL